MDKLKIPGGVLVFLGALFWSLNAPIVKSLTADSVFICGMRSLIAGVTLAVLIRPKQLKWTRWMAVYFCSYCALCLSIIVALSKTSSAVAIGMQYTAVVWLFLAKVWKTRKVEQGEWLPILMIMIGILFFMYSGKDGASRTGNLIAFFEGIIFAVMTASSKRCAGTNPLGLTALANLFTGIVVFSLFPHLLKETVLLSGKEWGAMLLLGVVQVAGGYGFYNMGVQKVEAQKASVIALWEMILGPVWTALFLKEYPSVPVLIGFGIILVGIYMDARRKGI